MQAKTFLSVLLLFGACNASSLKLTDKLLTEGASEIQNFATTELVDGLSTDEPTYSETTGTDRYDEQSIVNSPASMVSIESLRSDETKAVEIHNGSLFRLMMTIFTTWDDDFMEPSSETFKNLSNGLGSELIDFIDNSQEATELNVTNFKLVEVQPSKDSMEKIYVTFLVSSKKELSGEDLSIAISNRIILYGGIYDYKATVEGFVLENISQEVADQLVEKRAACDSGEVSAAFSNSQF